jgi:hypothetical protein
MATSRDKFRTPALIAGVGAGALAAGGLTMLHSDTHPIYHRPIYHRPVDRDRLPALLASILGGVPPWNWSGRAASSRPATRRRSRSRQSSPARAVSRAVTALLLLVRRGSDRRRYLARSGCPS